ncbi:MULTISPECIES: hypothetical protein [Pantoea]|nr:MULTISPECIES: hypothetical protein [Pantoea]
MVNTESKTMSRRKKITLAILISLAVVMVVVWNFVLPMIAATGGGSFGYGFPSGSGGRAIRSVEIDVDPQVVYRIDDHRFFTFENYVSCSSGGFVYYNDTNKRIKKLAGIEGSDKKLQNEVSISERNDVLSFIGKFIYSAGDNIIAYPTRDINYKYGNSTHFISFQDVNDSSKDSFMKVAGPNISIIVMSDSVLAKTSILSEFYYSHKAPLNSGDYNFINDEDLVLNSASIDDRFHCNESIKPRKIKYISN